MAPINEPISVDLGGFAAIVAVRLQGNAQGWTGGSWVSKFQLATSIDGRSYNLLPHTYNGCKNAFDISDPVFLPEGTAANYIRLIPVEAGQSRGNVKLFGEPLVAIRWDVIHALVSRPPVVTKALPVSNDQRRLELVSGQAVPDRPLVIQVVGVAAHGKSSTINTFATALSGSRSHVKIASTSSAADRTATDASWTLSLRRCMFANGNFIGTQSQLTSTSAKPTICIVDSMGVRPGGAAGGADKLTGTALSAFVAGTMKDGWNMQVLPKAEDLQSGSAVLKPDCIVIIVEPAIVGAAASHFKELKAEAVAQGVRLFVIVDKIDIVDVDCVANPRNAYTSAAVQSLIRQAAASFGVEENDVFAMKNYTSEMTPTEPVNQMALDVIEVLMQRCASARPLPR